MDLFNPFDTDTTDVIHAAYASALDIWAEADVNWQGVSFNVGHAAAYGRNIAYCVRAGKLIAWNLDNDHSQIYPTNTGARYKHKVEFKGTAIHELGHVAQFNSATTPWNHANLIAPPASVTGVHAEISWQWLCMIAWQALGGEAGKTVSERTMRVAMKLAPQEAHTALQHFSPYHVPTIFTRKGALRLLAFERSHQTLECPECGTEFKQNRTGRTAKFCSSKCKTRDYRARKAAEAAEVEVSKAA